MKLLFGTFLVLSLSTSIHAGNYMRKQTADERSIDYEIDSAPLSPPGDDEPLIAKQFSKDPHAGEDKVALVLSGVFKLTHVIMSNNQDEIMGYFCDFEFDQANKDPSEAPRYIDFYGESRHCQEHQVALPLHEIAEACRTQDEASSIAPDAFILHQPKSGSSILSNMLAASRTDIRVISEPTAIGEIVKCEKCDNDLKVQTLKDAIYLLGRDQEEGQLFVKLNARNTIGLPVLTEAFPDSKYLYLYRDPQTVLQKLMNKRHEKRVCEGYRHIPGEAVSKFLAKHNKSLNSLESEEKACAAVMAAHMSLVLEELENDVTSGRIVSYEELLDDESIEDLFDYLEVYTPNWTEVNKQRNKRANTGQGEEWIGESLPVATEKVQLATEEFSMFLGA